MNDSNSQILAKRIRIEATKMVSRAKGSHLGGALSSADIIAVLYSDVLRVRCGEPTWLERDRFILSKGHCCTVLYAALAMKGFIPVADLATYGTDGSRLMSHVSAAVPGVEFSTGSLGHGLPFGAGRALAAKRKGLSWRTFVLLSDGELDEGSNWEALLFAPQYRLDNLIAVIDYNKIQSLGSVSDVVELEPLADKLRAFRWAVIEVDGHDHDALSDAFRKVPREPGKPTCVIAHTVKGKGVPFMENTLAWHYKSPDTDQLAAALHSLGDD